MELASRVAILVLGAESEDKLRDYVTTHGVRPTHVAQIDDDQWPGFHATPTLLLADSSGAVLEARVGKLNAPEEDRVLTSSGF